MFERIELMFSIYDKFILINCPRTNISEYEKNLISAFQQLSYISFYQNHPINIKLLEKFPYLFDTAVSKLGQDPIAEYIIWFYINVGIHDRFMRKKFIPPNAKLWCDSLGPELSKIFTDPDYLADQTENNGYYITNLNRANLLAKIRKFDNILPNASLVVKDDQIYNEVYDINHPILGKYIQSAVNYLETCFQINSYHPLELIIDLFKTGDIDYYDKYIESITIKNGINFIIGFNETYRDIFHIKSTFTCIIFSYNPNNIINNGIKLINNNFKKYEIDLLGKNYNSCTRLDVAGNMIYAGGDNFGIIPIGFKTMLQTGENRVSLTGQIFQNNCALLHLIFPNLIQETAKQDPPKRQFYSAEIYAEIIKWQGTDSIYFTLLHEFGHSSGENNIKSKLGEYFNIIEESRADLFALYNIYNYPYARACIYYYLTTNFFIQSIRAVDYEINGAHFTGRYYIASSIIRAGQSARILDIAGNSLDNPESVELRIYDFEKLRELFKEYFLRLQKIKDNNDIASATEISEIGKKTIREWTENSKKICPVKPFPAFVFSEN